MCADCIKQVPKKTLPFFSSYHRLRQKKKNQHLENATSSKLGKDLFNEMMLVFMNLT